MKYHREAAPRDDVGRPEDWRAVVQEESGGLAGEGREVSVIDSLLHPEAERIRSLLTRSGRLKQNATLIDDEENILQALSAGVSVGSVFFAGEQVVSERLRRALPPGVPIRQVAWRTCKKLFGTDKISRLFALAVTPAPTPLSAIESISRDIVVLEDVSISGNIGNVLRTSVAFGLGAMVLLNLEPVDVFDRRLIRASRGFVFGLPIITASTTEFVRRCQDSGRKIVLAEAHADAVLDDIVGWIEPLALTLGSEKQGASQVLANAAALRVRIPTDPRVESLNVSAAAAILLHSRRSFNIPRA